MVNTSPNFGLQYLFANQSQKEVFVNQNSVTTDAFLQPNIVSNIVTTPPLVPNDGDKYIVPAGAVGVWTGLTNNVAAYSAANLAWNFFIPKTGWMFYNIADGLIYYYTGAAWTPISIQAAGTGLVAKISANAWAYRSIIPPTKGIVVSNPDGVAGNPIISLADDLAAIQALTGTGILSRTGTATWAQRTLTAAANVGLTVTNGDGVAGNPALAFGNYLPSGTGAVARTVLGKLGEPYLSAVDFGAVGNAINVQSATTTIGLGSAALTTTGTSFALADVGKAIEVAGAGAAGAALITTIAGWTSATSITLGAVAGTALAGVAANILYGTDNTVALQSWLTACQTSFMPGMLNTGVFMHTSALNIASNGVIIFGQGTFNSYLKPVSNIDCLNITTTNICEISNLSIYYTTAGVSGTAAIRVSPSSGTNMWSNFYRLHIQYAYSSIKTTRASLWTINSCLFDMTFSTAGGEGVFVSNLTNGDNGDSTIIGCIFSGNPASRTMNGIRWESSGGLRICNNKIFHLQYGFYCHLANGVATSDILFSNNSIEDINSQAIFFDRAGATGVLNNIVITGNQFFCNYAVNIPNDVNGVWMNGITFCGNNFVDSGAGTPVVIVMNSCTDVAVSGNSLRFLIAAAQPWFFANTVDSVRVTGNSFYGTFTNPTTAATNSMVEFWKSTVATLPTVVAGLAGSTIYATNARNGVEGGGAGTGCWCRVNSAGNWLADWSGLAVTS